MTLISIITPLHNAGRFISQTIESVIAQTVSDWELIIVDDLSQDDGPEIVASYVKGDPRIKLVRNSKNSGPAISRNKAIKLSSGRFIAFLDSDDIWSPKKLEVQIDFMLKNQYAFTFATYEKISESGKSIGIINAPTKVTYNDLLKTCSVGCLTAVYDTFYLGKVYMPDIKKRQDYALWLSILKIVPYGYGIKLILGKYRVRPKSVSSNKFSAASFQWKIYRNIENFGFWKSLYYFSNYSYFGVIKSLFNNKFTS